MYLLGIQFKFRCTDPCAAPSDQLLGWHDQAGGGSSPPASLVIEDTAGDPIQDTLGDEIEGTK